MKIFKRCIIIILPFLLFIVLLRTTLGNEGVFGTFDFLQLFNDFPNSEFFINQLNVIVDSINNLFNFTDSIDIIPLFENDLIGINYVIQGLNSLITTIFELFGTIFNLVGLLSAIIAYLGQILSWLFGCFGKILIM